MINIAVDGPAGAGKSTISKAVANKLGFVYVDTGALYRAVGVYALKKNTDTKNADAVTALLPEIDVRIKFINDAQAVFLNGEDVSTDIRLPEASMAASNVSAIPAVRTFLFDLQRNIARDNNCIMDGRDIGTVVLPDAQIKIFLTAKAELRAKRRYDELIAKGQKVEYDDVLTDLKQRDYNDSHREIAPLKPAEDSVYVDTTDLNLEQSVEYLYNVIKERM